MLLLYFQYLINPSNPHCGVWGLAVKGYTMWKRFIVFPMIIISWILAFFYSTTGWYLDYPILYFLKIGLGPLVVLLTDAKYPILGILISIPLLAGIVSHPLYPKLLTCILSILCVLLWFFISMTVLMLEGS